MTTLFARDAVDSSEHPAGVLRYISSGQVSERGNWLVREPNRKNCSSSEGVSTAVNEMHVRSARNLDGGHVQPGRQGSRNEWHS